MFIRKEEYNLLGLFLVIKEILSKCTSGSGSDDAF